MQNVAKNPFLYLKSDYLDEDTLSIIDTITPRPQFDLDKNMWIVPRNEALKPGLRSLPWQEMEVAEAEYNARLLANTSGQIADRSSRVYLDFSNFKLLKLANEPRNRDKIFYDPEKRKYFIPASLAYHKSYAGIIQRYTLKKMVTADELARPHTRPSNGLIQLAAALNISDPTKRFKTIAELIPQLLTEKYEKMPGALGKWEDILLSPAMARDHNISFSERCRYCEMFRQSQKVVKKAVKDFEKNRDEQTYKTAMTAARQINLGVAGHFMKENFEKRLRYAAAVPDASASVSLARSVMMDYAEGTALEANSSMFLKPVPGYPHNAAAFNEVARRILNSPDIINDPEKRKRYGQLVELGGRSCDRLNRLAFTGSNLRNMNLFERYQNIQTQISNNSYYLNAELNDLDIRAKLPRGHLEQIPVLDGRLEPLFLAVPERDQREFFMNNKDAVRVDPQFGHICVADTPENRKRFSSFMPKDDQEIKIPPSHEELIAKAKDLLAKNGFDVSRGIKADEHWHSDPKDPSKRYVVNFENGVPRLSAVDLNGSLKQSFVLTRSGESRPFTIEEKRAFARAAEMRSASARAKMDQLKNKRAAEVRELVSKLSAPTRQDHPYLDSKGLTMSDLAGVKYDPDGSAVAALLKSRDDHRKFCDSIIAPLINIDGKVVDTQIITQEKLKSGDGTKQKFYAKDAPAKGAMFVCGGYERLKNAKAILVAEGIATAATIQKFSPPGTVVVAAMSCGNLGEVTKALSDRYPQAGLHIMSDNDVRSAGVDRTNAGIAAAFASANDLSKSRPHMSVSVPPFTAEELKRGLSDFNDAMVRQPFDTEERYQTRVQATISRIQDAVNSSVMQHEIHVDAVEATLHQMNEMEQQDQLLKAKIHAQYDKFRNEKPVGVSYDECVEKISSGMRM
ncbi:MAG: toprim domain-containing protein [Succinatimonas hippei]|nr:toprim domain-containing protein [Succinatimonas hippei]